MVLSTHDLNLAAALCRAPRPAARGGACSRRARRDDVLTPDRPRRLYGVDADVALIRSAGHLTGDAACARVPLDARRSARGWPSTLAGFGAAAAGRCARCAGRWSAARASRSARVFDRSIPFADNVDAQIFFIARLPRVLAAALVGAALATAGRRVPGAAAESAGDAGHARRLERRARSARCWRSPSHFDFTLLGGLSSMPLASFAGSVGALAIVYALATARRRGLSTIVLLLAGVTMTRVLLGADPASSSTWPTSRTRSARCGG